MFRDKENNWQRAEQKNRIIMRFANPRTRGQSPRVLGFAAVLLRKNETGKRNFHKFSIFVWAVWLIPFFSGMIFAMIR